MKKGFSLVELAVVIIVIGLLIAAIASAGAILKQANTRRVVAAVDQARQAYNGFMGEYNEMPGDMADASTYWPTTCGVSNAACNGNGNSQLDLTFAADTDESLKLLKHLTLAGFLNLNIPLIPDAYTHPLNYSPQIGDGMGYSIAPPTFIDQTAGAFQLFRNSDLSGVLAYVGKARTGNPRGFNGFYFNSAFTPYEAYAVDHKMDDGVYDGTHYVGSGTGQLMVTYGIDRKDVTVFNDCVQMGGTYVDDPGSYYVVANTAPTCMILFKLAQ
ncbi:MAG: type II secretion system protein [Gammaproteobacteria bacterium]